MGDIAQILKDTQAPSPSKAMAMSGIPKDVMSLLGGKQDPKSAALPPITPTLTDEIKVKVGNKTITSSKPARQWAWTPFASSSRTDGALFRHWVRANVEYTDYPYAKFDVHLDPVIYSEEEYSKHLKHDEWTKSETDKLMELARKLELRWPVIHDRWMDHYASSEDASPRKIEDLQERYYNVAAILAQVRIQQESAAEFQDLSNVKHDAAAPNAAEKLDQNLLETAAARALATSAPTAQPLISNLGTGSNNKMFDAAQERQRRSQLDRMWRRSREEEEEEMELRKELKEVEAQLRKLKKSGGHVLAAAGNRSSSAAPSRNTSRATTPIPGTAIIENPDLLDKSFSSTHPVPMPQNPYLQSFRLAPPALGGNAGLNKSMLTRMQQVLAELKVPARPLPTKRVCDVYDSVRKDTLMLVTLQKMAMQKEGTLHAKRVKLSKLGGMDGKVLDEEELLGIAPPPAPPVPAPAVPSKKSSKPSSTGSKPKSSGSTSKVKTTAKPKGNEAPKKEESKDGSTKKKPTAKRKRKPETKEGSKDTTTKQASKTPSASPAAPSASAKTPSKTSSTPAAAPAPTPTTTGTPTSASKPAGAPTSVLAAPAPAPAIPKSKAMTTSPKSEEKSATGDNGASANKRAKKS